MISDQTFILYSLPKSRTTQQLFHSRKIEKAWEKVGIFLNSCTNISPEQVSSIELVSYSAYAGDPKPEVAEKIAKDLKLLFGNGKTVPLSYSYPEGIPDIHTRTSWILDKQDLNRALDYLINGQPWIKYAFGPVELIITYTFKLKYPTTDILIPNQKLNSQMILWLSRNSQCSPDLYFPFTEPNTEFRKYLIELTTFLPFKLENKFLRLGRPNKNKTNHIFTKIQDWQVN